jgi:hypothetical protein
MTVESISNSLFFALNYHRTHNNKRIRLNEKYAYLIDIYLDKSDYIVVKKSTQAGISEWLTVNVIEKCIAGRSIFYVLPTDSLASRFVRNRIDRTLSYSNYYKSVVNENKGNKYAESMFLKHIGKGTIAFCGSNAQNVFTEFPADDLFVDEMNMCNQDNLNMAWERLSASENKAIIKISNPTFEGVAIDEEYNKSDKKQWHIKCSSCGKWIIPDFFNHVVRHVEGNTYLLRDEDYSGTGDIKPICHLCSKPYNRYTDNGKWITQRESKISGYQISKLFSTNVKISELVERFNDGLLNDTAMQRFYNGDLGLAYTSKGAKIDYDMLDACRQDYLMPSSCKNPCVMGIDVGTKLHVRIDELLADKTKAVYIGTVTDIEDIIDLLRRYNVKAGCIDAMPERRLSKKICSLHKFFFMVYFGNDIKKETINPELRTLVVDRTSSLDNVKESILSQNIILPKNAKELSPLCPPDNVSEYYSNMTASVRVYDEKRQRYLWTEGNKPDHYMFAEVYKSLAKKLLVTYKGN